LTSQEKLDVAKALSRLGVDVIEAGFPAASPDDLQAVREIATHVGNEARKGTADSAFREPPVICGLARAMKKDIEKSWEAVRAAKHPRIHTFLATSPIHREHKLRMSRSEVVDRIRMMVAYARNLCEDIEFSPEDAGRTEPDFLYEALVAAIEAGATTLNIPDTVGYTLPDEFGNLIRGIKEHVPGVDQVTLSIHCHNDLGLATANTLAGVCAGARQVEVAVNGIGERAGNTALEEVVMALHTRKKLLGLNTGIVTTELLKTSRLISKSTGMMVQANKAIVGANAFAHEAGIHQDGMLKHQETYEIMRPETVGAAKTQLVLGKHSGRHAFATHLEELGYPIEGDELKSAFERFKILADKKKYITDADIVALITSQIYQPKPHFALDALQVGCGTMGMPTATVRLKTEDGSAHTEAAVGDGPIDACYRAIDAIVQTQTKLLEFSVNSVTEGIDALGEVSVRVEGDQTSDPINPQHGARDTRVYHGHGADTDIVVASAKAYISAITRLLTAVETRDAVS
ncbi:MAG: 2-isopropylmalate synthase, partial [Myxococcota bacterium]